MAKRETDSPRVYIIAGPNGAGKTTFAEQFLPQHAQCVHFVNADLIAQGLSPFSPQVVAIKAGKLLLSQLKDLARRREDFAFETTLSGKTHHAFLKNLKKAGYTLHLFFLWVPNPDFALARIRDRVVRGGHDVLEQDVRRRFKRSLENFFGLYMPLLDSWFLFDNSTGRPSLVAASEHGKLAVERKELFEQISVGRTSPQ